MQILQVLKRFGYGGMVRILELPNQQWTANRHANEPRS
jgi:hypothetical protein